MKRIAALLEIVVWSSVVIAVAYGFGEFHLVDVYVGKTSHHRGYSGAMICVLVGIGALVVSAVIVHRIWNLLFARGAGVKSEEERAHGSEDVDKS